MSVARSISEWLAFGLLKAAARCMTIAGVALVVPGLTLRTLWQSGEQGAAIADAGLRLGATFLVGGLASLYLAGSRGKIFPNESADRAAARTATEGWLIVVALALVALPLWLIMRLEPLISISSDIIEFLGEQGVWQAIEKDSQFSGVILMPVVAVLAVPFLEVAAASSFLAGSAILLVLMRIHSARFPRAFLMCVVMQGTLVLTSVFGVQMVAVASPIVERAISEGTTTAAAAEARRALEEIERYGVVIRATVEVLIWTWMGYLVWTPALFLSGRIKTTFAFGAPSGEPSIEQAHAQDRVRRWDYRLLDEINRAKYYQEAASKLDASGPAVEANRPALLAAAVVAGLFVLFVVYSVIRVLRGAEALPSSERATRCMARST